MLNEPQHKDWRIGQLAGFWEGNRVRLAQAAKVLYARADTHTHCVGRISPNVYT